MLRSPRAIITLIVVLIGLLALASYLTTSVLWDGGFLSVAFRILVVDDSGAPVSGASIEVFRDSTSEPAYGYPFNNFTADNALTSNAKGEIVCYHVSHGIEFGGHSWRLFWLIPMGARSPDFDAAISCPGYETTEFKTSRLFDLYRDGNEPIGSLTVTEENSTRAVYSDDGPRTMPLDVDNATRKLPTYDHKIVLRRKN